MLVSDIERMEGAQSFVPFAVRFETQQELERILRESSSLFYSFYAGFVTLPRAIGVDLQGGSFGLFVTSVDPKQFPVRMIQRGPEVVEGVPHHKRAIHFDLRVDVHGSEAAIRFELYPGRIRAFAEDSLQIADVMFGPINL